MDVSERRETAVAEAMARVRAIVAGRGETRPALDEIRDVMIALAAKAELFPPDEFPLAPDGTGERFDVLSVDDDGRHELYLEVADAAVSTPPHDHRTWAVVVGVRGLELNRIYEGDGGPAGEAPLRLAREVAVRPGTGVCLMPDDFHSIHIAPGELAMHLHLYGRRFADLTGRRMYDEATGAYLAFDGGL